MSVDDNITFQAGRLTFSICKFDSLDSTNIFLKNHLSDYPDFAVIVTKNQLDGRGRFDRKWQSSPGNSLTFSIKIPVTDIPQQKWTNITQVMALSVACFLEDSGLQPLIRWPNDILINNRKICGILAEVAWKDTKSSIILGVGLNVNNPESDFKNLDRPATSLLIETKKSVPTEEILLNLLQHFALNHISFLKHGFSSLSLQISEKLYNQDMPVQILQGNDTFAGTIRGITENGTLLIETSNGIRELVSGEITSRNNTIG
jgi:BirA family biotin operon repressor/biotin-[acetyl-CoA-carboxylase] ligase